MDENVKLRVQLEALEQLATLGTSNTGADAGAGAGAGAYRHDDNGVDHLDNHISYAHDEDEGCEEQGFVGEVTREPSGGLPPRSR